MYSGLISHVRTTRPHLIGLTVVMETSLQKFATFKREGNWAELTLSKTSGIVTRDRGKNWPIADQRILQNNPRNNCATNFGSSSLSSFRTRGMISGSFYSQLSYSFEKQTNNQTKLQNK